jgi:uncharacterized membrane-anchored protein
MSAIVADGVPTTLATPSRRRLLIGVVAAFVIQAGLLAAMVVDRALLLARGTEIRLPVVPVDPRDFLRGDYVILSYEISRLRSNPVEGGQPLAVDQTVYVAVRWENGSWRAGPIYDRPPQSGLFLKGKIEGVRQDESECPAPCRTYQVAYNLEQFFVPEGKGRALEQLRNDQRLEVDVAIAGDGRAALKRLLVDGAVRHEDPLF